MLIKSISIGIFQIPLVLAIPPPTHSYYARHPCQSSLEHSSPLSLHIACVLQFPSIKDFHHLQKGISVIRTKVHRAVKRPSESQLQRLGHAEHWITLRGFFPLCAFANAIPNISEQNRWPTCSSHQSDRFKTRINRFNHKENQHLDYDGILTQALHQHPTSIFIPLSAHDRSANYF